MAKRCSHNDGVDSRTVVTKLLVNYRLISRSFLFSNCGF